VSLPAAAPLSELAAEEWDLLVIGGGIVGAGVMREAARRGLRVLLLEQRDFASGTSSRSSKLIHGGLRYLAQRDLSLVHDAARERDRLVRHGPGIVEPIDFVLPSLPHHHRSRWVAAVGLGAYDLLGHHRPRRHGIGTDEAVRRLGVPLDDGFRDAFLYQDAQTDDARLVLRVLREGCNFGGRARSYTAVTRLLRDERGVIVGAEARDADDGVALSVRARTVVNATGAWSDGLRRQVGAAPRLRLLRGSHLVFPARRLPVRCAFAANHLDTGRALYVIPWGGVTLVGSTDVDHDGPLEEPHASLEEIRQLLRGVQVLFPALCLETVDIQATFAGVRAIDASDGTNLADLSRRHAIGWDAGMLTIVGGKLTTFRSMALEALERLRTRFPELGRLDRKSPALEPLPPIPLDLPLDPDSAVRCLARYGSDGLAVIAAAPTMEQTPIPGTSILPAELRWAARAEAVHHLDDLLLRRVAVGLCLPDGGLGLARRLRGVLQSELGWSDRRWESELDSYRQLWLRTYTNGVTSRDARRRMP
jgi:glycerol-3-phosphate dehydrogenase